MGEVIRARLGAHPFVPFRLVLTDGRAYEVRASDLATVRDEVVELFGRPDGRPNGRTLSAVVSLRHVVLIEGADDPALVTEN